MYDSNLIRTLDEKRWAAYQSFSLEEYPKYWFTAMNDNICMLEMVEDENGRLEMKESQARSEFYETRIQKVISEENLIKRWLNAGIIQRK